MGYDGLRPKNTRGQRVGNAACCHRRGASPATTPRGRSGEGGWTTRRSRPDTPRGPLVFSGNPGDLSEGVDRFKSLGVGPHTLGSKKKSEICEPPIRRMIETQGRESWREKNSSSPAADHSQLR